MLRSHVVIGPFTELGEDNEIYAHCTLGMGPQDLKFKGAPTRLRIGDRNVVRESCTMHRGTEHGGGLTTVGDDNFFMTGSHIAHDCHVGNSNIFANCATLAGHVEVGDFCTVGAFSAVHQFCRVGSHAFMGGFTVATLDVLPYMKTVGARDTKSYGVNTIGLRRRGFPRRRHRGPGQGPPPAVPFRPAAGGRPGRRRRRSWAGSPKWPTCSPSSANPSAASTVAEPPPSPPWPWWACPIPASPPS